MGQQKAKILSDRALRNRDCFDTRMDAEIKHLKAEAKKMLNLEAKVVAQRSVKDLEKKRGEKRVKLYQA